MIPGEVTLFVIKTTKAYSGGWKFLKFIRMLINLPVSITLWVDVAAFQPQAAGCLLVRGLSICKV